MNFLEATLRAQIIEKRLRAFVKEADKNGFDVKFKVDQNVGIVVGIFDLFTEHIINYIFPFQESLYAKNIGDYEIDICRQLCKKLEEERQKDANPY